jgi:hypothetical protein
MKTGQINWSRSKFTLYNDASWSSTNFGMQRMVFDAEIGPNAAKSKQTKKAG